MKIDRIHYVAYRCRDAKETVLRYQTMLNEWTQTKRAPTHGAFIHAREFQQ